MRKIWHIAATAAGTSLLALGGAIAGTGVANASTNVHVTSCNDTASGLSIGLMPTCTSSGTVRYPTSIKLTVNSPELTSLLNPVLSGIGQGIKDTWHLSCYANSTQILNESGTFEVTSSQTRTTTNLPLHSQTPSYCRVTTTVSTLIGVSTGLLGNLVSLGVSDDVTADTAVPNGLRNDNGWCADATANSNGIGAKVQIWRCISDHAQRWIYAPDSELVHEGRCLGYNASGATVLQACTGAAGQIWHNVNGNGSELRSNSGRCLTAADYRNGAYLHAETCRGTSEQRWQLPTRARY